MREKIVSPFTHKDSTDHEDASTYVADFQLPDDGTPNSAQHLRVKVIVPNDLEVESTEIALSVLGMDKTKERPLGYFETRAHDALAGLLYGAVTRRKVDRFRPVPRGKEDRR